jgi:dTDP-4-dehydrorhamnose 3,5-epimerase-like enzyme
MIYLPTFHDSRGELTVIENVLPFSVKRIYYITNSGGQTRGGHRHLKTIQAAICLAGSCTIFLNDGSKISSYLLDSKSECLIINPEDFHWMTNFTKDAILLVLASEEYDKNDYVYDSY